MSIMYCDHHGHWDSDFFENCRGCENIGKCGWCGYSLAEADGPPAVDDHGKPVCSYCADWYRDNCDTPGDVRDYT